MAWRRQWVLRLREVLSELANQFSDDLVIHCAVLGSAGDDTVELVKYLVKNCPEYTEKRTCEGETPLMLACRLGRTECASVLIDAGADQSIRNQKGENILHVATSQRPKADVLKPLLDLFNPELRSHLFLQRKNLQENGTTPLHTWVSLVCGVSPDGEDVGRYRYSWNRQTTNVHSTYANAGEVLDVLKLLLQYSGGDELDMLNGAGETCLHTAARRDRLAIVKALVDYKPALLGRENAVGRTPAEVVHDSLIAQALTAPNEHNRTNDNDDFASKIIGKGPEFFAHNKEVKGKLAAELKPELAALGLSGEYKGPDLALIKASIGLLRNEGQEELPDLQLKQVMWDIVSTAMTKNPPKRRLVSLNEANDVAKRLGEKHTGSRYFSIENRRREDDDEDSTAQKKHEPPSDFVTTQLPSLMPTAWKVPENPEDE